MTLTVIKFSNLVNLQHDERGVNLFFQIIRHGGFLFPILIDEG